jgi:hypothetical protein
VWTGSRQPLYFDTAITTRGFTGHEEIDPMGLIHMNGRVYDPELSCFSFKATICILSKRTSKKLELSS